MRFHNASLSVMLYLDEMTCFLAAEYSFWWCDVRTDGGEVEDVEGCGRLSVTRWFIGRCAVFVCKLVGSLAGEMNVSFMVVLVVVGGSASGLGDRRVCVEVV